MNSRNWIQTRSGKRFHFLDPDVNEIDIRDIAAHLSKLCRFTGATSKFYSVAEHCYRCSLLVPPDLALQALLHDASEAYLGDVGSQLKQCLGDYQLIESDVQRSIYEAYSLPTEHAREVKEADYRLLATEARVLLHPLHPSWEGWISGIKPLEEMKLDAIGWFPDVAERYFAERAEYLLARPYRKASRPSRRETAARRAVDPMYVDAGHIHWFSEV